MSHLQQGAYIKRKQARAFQGKPYEPDGQSKWQTLSALITDEPKEMVVKTKTDEMSFEDYDKLLDKYEALYATDNEESENSNSET